VGSSGSRDTVLWGTSCGCQCGWRSQSTDYGYRGAGLIWPQGFGGGRNEVSHQHSADFTPILSYPYMRMTTGNPLLVPCECDHRIGNNYAHLSASQPRGKAQYDRVDSPSTPANYALPPQIQVIGRYSRLDSHISSKLRTKARV
jgi:hypothetical protein